MTDDDLKELNKFTTSVPVAGRILGGLGRNASYEAADRGDIETFKLGKLKRVRVNWIRRQLALPDLPVPGANFEGANAG